MHGLNAYVAAAFKLSLVKMLLKREVGGYMHLIVMENTLLIVDNHGKIMELCFRIPVGTLSCTISIFWLVSVAEKFDLNLTQPKKKPGKFFMRRGPYYNASHVAMSIDYTVILTFYIYYFNKQW